MAFPQTPLDIKVDLKVDGVWQDVTPDVLTRDLLTITRGRPDEGARTDPGKCKLTFNNGLSRVNPAVSGRYSTGNPLSDLFGKIGRNTPVRVHLPAPAAHLELDGNPAGNVATPHVTALNITGDLDVRVEVDADMTDTARAQTLIGKWGESAPERSWLLRYFDGNLTFFWLDAAAVSHSVFVGVQLIGGSALRVTLDVDNAAGGHTVRFWEADSIDGTWRQLFGDITVAGTTSVQSTTSPLVIGPADSTTTPVRVPFTGNATRFQVRSGIGGTLVADADFRPLADAATGFTDSAGRVWTVNGTAKIRKRADRFNGEISSWPPRWDVSGKDRWVPVDAAGVLRRYGQGSAVLQSSLRRRIPSFAPLAYWPMEEGASATQASSPIDGVQPLTLTPARWAATDTLTSSGPLPQLAATTSQPEMRGRVPAPATTLTAWHVQWIYFITAGPASRRTFMRVLSTGSIAEWLIQSGTDGTTLLGRDADGSTVVTHSIATGLDLFGQWVHVRFAVTQNGGNIDYSITWTDIGGDAGQFASSTTGTVGRPTAVASPASGFSSDLDGMAIGHISVWPTSSTAAYTNAITAWQGEPAGQRMLRLALEEKLPLTVRGAIAEQERMGAQDRTALLDLIGQGADSDGGILTEHRARPALRYRSRATLYNQQPALTLNYAAGGEVAPPLEPLTDDADVVNDVTVTRIDGSSGRAVLEEGPLSVLAPPDGIGTGYDTSVQLSLNSDAQTEPIAYWRLHLGTVDAPRYPVVRVNLAAAPHLIDTVLGVDQGDLIRITNPPAWLPPGDVDLIVQGYTESFDQYAWDIAFTCTPAAPWAVGTIGSQPGRIDANPGGSLLAAAATATDTTLTVHTPAAGATHLPAPFVTSTDRLTTNPDFETDLAGWTATGGTITRVATPQPAPFGGQWSLLLTPSGAASTTFASSPAAAAISPGTAYVPYGWLRCAVARTVNLNVNWYDSGGAYLSTSSISKTVEAGAWTEFTASVTAPASAATARVLPTLTGTPPASHLLHADVTFLGSGAPGSFARDFPFDIRFGGEVARVTANAPGLLDTFGRTVAGGWGTADTGQTWTVVGTAADYSVGSGYGSVAQPSVGIAHLTLAPAPAADVDLYLDVATSVLAAGASLFAGPVLRAVSNADFYMARLDFTTTAGIVLTVRKRVANVETQLGTVTTTLTHTAGTFYRVRFQASGSTLRAKVWAASAAEPRQWQIEVTDTAITAANSVGTRSFANTGSTAVNPSLRFDNLVIVTPQRMTVTRSVNGITKAHAAGTEVRLAQPAVIAL